MTLQQIFDLLSHGELSQIDLGGTNGIEESNWDRVLSAVNLGLTELHKRFPLRREQVVLQMQGGQLRYTLDVKFAVSNLGNPTVTKYLIDSVADPFLGRVLKIEKVFDASGCELNLNRLGDTFDQAHSTVRTPSYNTLILPTLLPVQALTIEYRGNHPLLVKAQGYFNPGEVTVELPDTHLTALLYFVASRLFNPTGLSGNTAFHEGNNYEAKFEAECQRLEFEGYENSEQEENSRLRRNGWV